MALVGVSLCPAVCVSECGFGRVRSVAVAVGVGWGPPVCEEVRTACVWVQLCQQGYGVCLYRVCGG